MNRLVSSLLLCSLVLTAAPLAVHADDELPPADPCNGCVASSGGGTASWNGNVGGAAVTVTVRVQFANGGCDWSTVHGKCGNIYCNATGAIEVATLGLGQTITVVADGVPIQLNSAAPLPPRDVPCGTGWPYKVSWGNNVYVSYLECTKCEKN